MFLTTRKSTVSEYNCPTSESLCHLDFFMECEKKSMPEMFEILFPFGWFFFESFETFLED